MQNGRKAVWNIPHVFVAVFPSLKQTCIAYRSSKVCSRPDCIFEIHQLWQSGFSRMYSNSCCSCSFKAEIIKIGPSSHKMYDNNILDFQESSTILNVCTKKSGNLLKAQYIYIYIYIYIYTKVLKTQKNATQILPCLKLSIIRYGSRIREAFQEKEVAPLPTPQSCSNWNSSSLVVALVYVWLTYFLIYYNW